ncbi:MAG: substrate-binding domain-containing protein [Eubacteriaceae bacterium]|nr:substrate-binding domain-containing protein [Eubacteriaceae bacterium]
MAILNKKALRRMLFFFLLLSASIFIFAACSSDKTTTGQKTAGGMPQISYGSFPKIDGSTATIPLAIELVKAVTGCSDAEAEGAIIFTTTDPSYEALLNGDADILLVYEASDSTKSSLSGFSSLDIEPVGRDALVFLANVKNPVDDLSTEQICGIYTGGIINWNEVGGLDMPITAFQRQEQSGSQTMMKKLVMDGKEMFEAPDPLVHYEMGGMVDAIGIFDTQGSSLGYSVYYYAKNMYELPDVKLLAVDGIEPSNETIQSGAYPHVNDFFCVLGPSPSEEAQLVAEWLLSGDGQRFIMECGYVPIR